MAGAFNPQGPTYVVGDVPVQCVGLGGSGYRVRNLQTRDSYLTWGPDESVVFGGVPREGGPSEDTIGLGGGRTEHYNLPANWWFVSDGPRIFEVTPGEGLT